MGLAAATGPVAPHRPPSQPLTAWADSGNALAPVLGGGPWFGSFASDFCQGLPVHAPSPLPAMALVLLCCPLCLPALAGPSHGLRWPGTAGGAADRSSFRVRLPCEIGSPTLAQGAIPTICCWQKLPVLPLRMAWPRPALGEACGCALLFVAMLCRAPGHQRSH